MENKEYIQVEQPGVVDLIEQLKIQLINSTKVYPKKLIEKIIQNQEAVTPTLLENLARFTNSSFRDISCEHWREGVVALAILSKFREQKAFPYLIKLCIIPHHTVDDFLGDVITELLAIALASTFNGDLNSICGIVKNQHLYEYVRGAALDALVILYRHNKISRETIISIFNELFDELYNDFSYMPSKLVSDSARIRAVELSEKIDHFFKSAVIDDLFVDYETVRDFFSKSEQEIMQELGKNYHYCFLDNLERAIGYLFRKDEVDAMGDDSVNMDDDVDDLFESITTPTKSEPKTGRNTPCPCGSGKKYKKCCLGTISF